MESWLLPPFTPDGLLPPGDYELTLAELAASMVVLGPAEEQNYAHWDRDWRGTLVKNLGALVAQLWQVGVTEIFVDGSFAEDKDRPNDIDGYFECDLRRLTSGDLQRELNRRSAWSRGPQHGGGRRYRFQRR